MLDAHLKVKRRFPLRGLIYGLTTTIPCLGSIFSMSYGVYLFGLKQIPFGNVFKIGELMNFSMEMVGNAIASAPNYGKARISANKIFKILSEKSHIESQAPSKNSAISGAVDFDSVHFRYPNRKDVAILNGLNMIAKLVKRSH